jgi:hypothetical protein
MGGTCASLLLAVAAVAVAGAAAEGGGTKPGPKDFKITTRKPADTVEIRGEKDGVVFEVRSPSGIGDATIAREAASWPKRVVLRLHLKGLEDFRVGNGKVTVHAAVKAGQGKPEVRQWKDGKEDAPLDGKSPYWLGLVPQRGDGKPAAEIPLKEGFFEVVLPPALFEGNPASISVRWIDFYRG